MTIKQSGQEGWALFGLILALAIMGIVLVSATTPNYRVQVQRDKEAELLFRGQQMAEAIARYYNRGNLGPVQLRIAPAYGYLKELSKLRDGITIGVKEIKFVRPSAMIDPMDGKEWEPVYARDPRIMPYLQAWSADSGGIIPPEYLLLASSPVKVQKNSLSESSLGSTSDRTGASSTGTGQQPGKLERKKDPNDSDDDDDDDDDDDASGNDPLGHIFHSGLTGGLPIVGVAPRIKGQTIRSLFGLKNYEEWVFIYIPQNNFQNQNPQNQNQNRRPTTTNE